MLCLKPSHTNSTAPVIRKLQTNSSDSYSTRDFPCGTPPTVRRHSLYYDVRLKKLVRRNVPYLPELPEEHPVPVPGLQAPRLGVQNTPTPLMINAALQVLRREVL